MGIMRPLIEEIKEVLTPNNSIGFVKDNKIFQLQPVLPITQFLSMAKDLDTEGQKKILKFVNSPNTIIFNGIIYIATKGLNLKGRLKEILLIYRNHLKEIVGDKKALIDLYEKVPPEDIANLTEDHVIFAMMSVYSSDKKELTAIRYLPDYEIHFESKTYKMPGCMLVLHIDKNLAIGDPEVVVNGHNYEHPFVYKHDFMKFGQKICMGSFYSSKDRKNFNNLRFANTINNLLKQAVQILVSGYNRGVSPANGHLTGVQYKKYIV